MLESRYALSPDVRIRRLDDDAIVFNPHSWETHLLNPAAALVLELSGSDDCTVASVADILAEVLDDAERPRAAEHARQLLNELVGLRLLVELAAEPDAGG
jgi:PqqD family protein of HPr-rel-A system